MAGQVKAEVRVYRTVDGALVRENDPRGAFLAYGVGDPIADAEHPAYAELVDGGRSGHEVPGLMHDRLATEIADAARVVGSAPAGPAAQVAQTTLEQAAEVVDASQIPPPAPAMSLPPSEIVRQVAQGAADDRPVAALAVHRATDGSLVAAGDPDASTVAYAIGDRVDKSDQDAYDEIAAAAAAPSKATRAKAAAKPADKAAAKPDNKAGAPAPTTTN